MSDRELVSEIHPTLQRRFLGTVSGREILHKAFGKEEGILVFIQVDRPCAVQTVTFAAASTSISIDVAPRLYTQSTHPAKSSHSLLPLPPEQKHSCCACGLTSLKVAPSSSTTRMVALNMQV